jgi:hypothetical protein
LTANTLVGNFTVSARLAGINTSATFSLTNNAVASQARRMTWHQSRTGPVPLSVGVPGPAFLMALPDSVRTAAKNGTFAGPQVRVTDAYGNVLEGVAVTFTVQANTSTGAGGVFNNAQSIVNLLTSRRGVAGAPKLHANGRAGTFTVEASVEGLSDIVRFMFTIL